MDTVVVTGSTGFLGGYVAEALARSGRRVLAMTRRAVRSVMDNVQPVQASLEDPGPLRRAAQNCGCRAVFHFAAVLPRLGGGLGLEEALVANVLGTARMLETLGERSDGLFVYASSMSVYAPSAAPLTEDSPIDPVGSYAMSKYGGELCCRDVARRRGLRAVSLRIAAPYGPGMPMDTVLPLFLSAALAGETPRYYGSGGRTQDFVHARDVARACLLALDRGSGAYNIGGGSGIAMRDLAGLALAVAGRDPREAQASGRPDPQEGVAWRLDIRRAAEGLGYTPEVGLEQGLRELSGELSAGAPRSSWWREA